MKMFVSWSGTRSRHIADSLRDWLPNVLQSVRPFISTRDIQKGTRGNVKITEELEEANVSIICLTPENLTAPWILFEAGALSKLSSAYVCTYLYELEPADVPQPLGQFQHTKAGERETFDLVATINSELDANVQLDQTRLQRAFEAWWPDLKKSLDSLPDKPDSEDSPPERTDDNKLDEVLKLVRAITKSNTPVHPAAPVDFVSARTKARLQIIYRPEDPEVWAEAGDRVRPLRPQSATLNITKGPSGQTFRFDVSTLSTSAISQLLKDLGEIASELGGSIETVGF